MLCFLHVYHNLTILALLAQKRSPHFSSMRTPNTLSTLLSLSSSNLLLTSLPEHPDMHVIWVSWSSVPHPYHSRTKHYFTYLWSWELSPISHQIRSQVCISSSATILTILSLSFVPPHHHTSSDCWNVPHFLIYHCIQFWQLSHLDSLPLRIPLRRGTINLQCAVGDVSVSEIALMIWRELTELTILTLQIE